jgi:hypothetical protein
MDPQQKIIEWASKHKEIVAVLLGGSRALGTHKSGSDYDIGVYLNIDPSIAVIEQLCADLELENPMPAKLFPTAERHFIMVGKPFHPKDNPEINLGIMNFLRFKESLSQQMNHYQVLQMFHFMKNARILYDPSDELKTVQAKAKLDWAHKRAVSDSTTLAKWNLLKYKKTLGEDIVTAQMLKNHTLWHIALIMAAINHISVTSRFEYLKLKQASSQESFVIPEDFFGKMEYLATHDDPAKLEELISEVETIAKEF